MLSWTHELTSPDRAPGRRDVSPDVPTWRRQTWLAAEVTTGESEQLPDFAEAVLELVDSIPAGRVLTYGDVAELLGRGGPRAVGTVLARYGGAVAWWRVLRAGGLPPAGHEARALDHYAVEGTPTRDGRVVLARARWAGPAAEQGGLGDPPDVRPAADR